MKKNFDVLLKKRITYVLIFFCILFATLIGKLFVLQIFHYKEYRALAARQHESQSTSVPVRGSILIQGKEGQLVPLAANRSYRDVVVSPKALSDPDRVASYFSQEFGIDKESLLKKFSKKDDEYEVVVKKIDAAKADAISALRMQGVFFEEEVARSYPHDSLGAHIIGFVSKENGRETGKYGLERMYDKELSGESELFNKTDSAAGFFSALGKRILRPPESGADLVLTVDYNIQLKAEEVLAKIKEKWQAASGLALVLEPKTGRILALAGQPNFNPGSYSKEKDFSVFLNQAIESRYELGSVIKPIMMAGGLEEKLITPASTYEDKGKLTYGKYTIKNFDEKTYGVQTMTQVLEKSLNTGAVYVARLLGPEKQRDYFKRFGFGVKTGVDLPGEVSGDISSLESGKDIDIASASFGQGIAVTPLQMASAMGVIANGGKLMRPYMVERIQDESGNQIAHHPETVRQVISPETAETLTKMLVSAVRNGFENRSGVKGYFIAGKTGTAQIPRLDGKGYSDKLIHTFVGFAPAFDARFVILLQLNEPMGNRFAANTLTPAFHDLAEFMLNYYEIPPDEK